MPTNYTWHPGSWFVNGEPFKSTIIANWGSENMEFLFKVYFVEKNRKIHQRGLTVAKSEEEAKFNVGVHEELKSLGLRLSDVTIIVKNLGSVEVESDANKTAKWD